MKRRLRALRAVVRGNDPRRYEKRLASQTADLLVGPEIEIREVSYDNGGTWHPAPGGMVPMKSGSMLFRVRTPFSRHDRILMIS